jgi:hypothetical protein
MRLVIFHQEPCSGNGCGNYLSSKCGTVPESGRNVAIGNRVLATDAAYTFPTSDAPLPEPPAPGNQRSPFSNSWTQHTPKLANPDIRAQMNWLCPFNAEFSRVAMSVKTSTAERFTNPRKFDHSDGCYVGCNDWLDCFFHTRS